MTQSIDTSEDMAQPLPAVSMTTPQDQSPKPETVEGLMELVDNYGYSKWRVGICQANHDPSGVVAETANANEALAAIHAYATRLSGQVGEPVAKYFDGYLCRAWGETDQPCAEVVRDLDGLKRFMVREWLGDENETDLDGGNTLQRFVDDFESHNWDNEDVFKYEFEIGGVSVERCYSYASTPPALPLPFTRNGLETVAEGLEKGYEQRIDVGEECPEVESTTAYAARFIRAYLAATPSPTAQAPKE
jgi:hypothetical protein